MMSSQELREKFLQFFKNNKDYPHTPVSSSSLVPDDPSVLFTTAGMQQFKRYYTGELDPLKDFGSKNVCSIQKCFRTSDIDEVGDESHLTFFEMLGNFSFGGYWKKETIEYAWEFLTKELKINCSRIHASVFAGDKDVSYDSESFEILKKLGINKVEKGSREDNFWGPTGKQGPCGPTAELYVDGVELWNLVFNEFYCHENGKLEPLKQQGVDTGMGLERLAMVVQGKKNIFETDLFEPIFKKLSEEIINEKLKRVIADHLRALVFIISEGVRPGKNDRPYILRRLMVDILKIKEFRLAQKRYIEELLNIIIENYSEFYHEIKLKKIEIVSEFMQEYRRIFPVIEKFSNSVTFYNLSSASMTAIEQQKLDDEIRDKIADLLFYSHQSLGIPIELSHQLLEDQGIQYSEQFWQSVVNSVNKRTEKHREISRAGVEKKFGGHGLILDTGELKAGNEEEIKKVTRLHTATHLLNQALHDVLGDEVDQRGSDITPQRTRFDFVLGRKMTQEEIKKVEAIVNEKIKEDLPVRIKEMPLEEALRLGVRKFYRAKYPSIAKVYYIGKNDDVAKAYSKEFCGGPHVSRTGEIGKFKVIKEEASSAGVRRIRAVIE